MVETTYLIRSEIEAERARLGADLDALERRLRQETDWRLQFARRPWVFLAVAFGAALLLGIVVGHPPATIEGWRQPESKSGKRPWRI
jgi:hypothetical protein